MTPDQTLGLLRAANPAPRPDRLDIQDDVLLLAISERSVNMSTDSERQATKGIPDLDEQKYVPMRLRGTRGWVIAAAAFAVAIFIGAAVLLLSAQNNEVEPADTTPPGTLFEEQGEGTAQLEFVLPPGPAIMAVTHDGSAEFDVMELDESGNGLILRIDTVGPYDGTVPIQVPFAPVSGLDVLADGVWTVEIKTLSEAPSVSCAAGYTGEGDEVVLMTDFIGPGGTAELTHRGPVTGHFIVIAHDDVGNDAGLIVSAGDLDETVDVPPGHYIWGVSSDGEWTIGC